MGRELKAIDGEGESRAMTDEGVFLEKEAVDLLVIRNERLIASQEEKWMEL